MRELRARKILVASLGVATVAFTACGQTSDVVGNFAVPNHDAATSGSSSSSSGVVGNLMLGGGGDANVEDANVPADAWQVVGNLMPVGQGGDASADATVDASTDATTASSDASDGG